MNANLNRLKGLGTAMGDEVDRQNELLNRINTKTDKTDAIIKQQDNQMKKLLDVKDPEPTVEAPSKLKVLGFFSKLF
jgi:hypothetical protein